MQFAQELECSQVRIRKFQELQCKLAIIKSKGNLSLRARSLKLRARTKVIPSQQRVQYLTYRKAHFKTLLLQYINLVGFKMIIAAGLLLIGGLLVINQQMNIGQFVASEIIIILVLVAYCKLMCKLEVRVETHFFPHKL